MEEEEDKESDRSVDSCVITLVLLVGWWSFKAKSFLLVRNSATIKITFP